MAERTKLGGHINKAGLVRVRVATVIVSVVTFVSSLGIIWYINPGIHGTTMASSQVQVASSLPSTAASTSKSSSAALQLPSVQQSSSLRPLTRTRGS
jgi:hypothetical protein